MKLRNRIIYILFPVIALVFTLTNTLYFFALKQQMLLGEATTLNAKVENISNSISERDAFIKSILRQHINSKEAALLFDLTPESSQWPTATTQFIKRFITEEQSKVIDELAIFNLHYQPHIYVNTQDPFANPEIKPATRTLIQAIVTSLESNSKQRFQQYYYLASFNEETGGHEYYLIQIFSPYLIAATDLFLANEHLYIAQTRVNIDQFLGHSNKLKQQYDGNLTVNRNVTRGLTKSMTIENVLYQTTEENEILSVIKANMFEITFQLHQSYTNNKLAPVKQKLIIANIAVIIGCFVFLFVLIHRQVIRPVTRLAQMINDTAGDDDSSLITLNKKDEVSMLNNSYVSLVGRINQLANDDPLTSLSNRKRFEKNLAKALPLITKEKLLGLIYIDLDNFKQVNDTHGHTAGDHLLIEFSKRLRENIRVTEQVDDKNFGDIARLGGDEFVIFLSNIPSSDALASIATRIIELFTFGFQVDAQHYDVHASIGVTFTNDRNIELQKLVSEADAAMYIAKKSGKNKYVFFNDEIEQEINHNNEIEQALKTALQQNSFFLTFMPTFCTKTQKVLGFEVLLRAPDLLKKGIGPEEFIPIAEQSNLICKIDLWVIENALLHLKSLITKHQFTGICAINISSKELARNDFPKLISELILQANVPPEQIELEITETCLIPDDKMAVKNLNSLKKIGVKLAIDDFGTGYTSFSQLVDYPLDTLKIDRSFMQQLATTPTGKKPTLDIIVDLANVYQLTVIVEGVETIEDLDYIKRLNCHMAQGYYYTKPLSFTEFEANYIAKKK